MISRIAVVPKDGTATPSAAHRPMKRPGFLAVLLLLAWCGTVAGLLEVGTILLRKGLFDPDRLYGMSRHFVWLIPASNLGVFLTLGLLGYGVILVWPLRGRWLLARVLCALTLLPSLLVAYSQIHTLAWFVLALGMATRIVPFIELRSRSFRRFVLVSFPTLIAVVAIVGGSIWVDNRLKQSRENSRPLPPPGSPNVLLIVMDTVAAGHLSLHGYDRSTSPTLVELAGRGITFDAARATSSWTLPSHASMFTGRWLHELSVGWLTPLDRARPTLAEFLGDRGYATAGFVANTAYCGTDSGLARGFTRYQDYTISSPPALKTAVLVNRALEGARVIFYYSEDWLRSAGLLRIVERLMRSLDDDRKGAEAVSRELLDWLAHRADEQRPYFAFVNYFDAHYAYQLAPGRLHRFGAEPTDSYQRLLIQHWGWLDKTTVSPMGVAFAADAYDDCIADLDERLGKLVDELDRRGNLEQTWLIITADHGESFGEHAGVFCHGMSLYETELHVPLLIIPPGGSATKQVVKEAVSLRDLAATIVDVVGQGAGSPFPGASLARFWKQASPAAPNEPAPAPSNLAEVVPLAGPRKHDYWGWPRQLPPLAAVKETDWSYIRREGQIHEELFHLSEDAKEQRNLASDPSARATLGQMRAAMDRLTGGPLLPERFAH
jgi:arylsulfatase A-like enzyme